MSESDYAVGHKPLTAFERQRLRPTVDPAALERWLVVSHGEFRRAMIAHFATEVTEDDLLAVRREAGLSDAVDPAAPTISEREPPEAPRDASAPSEGLHFLFVSTWQPIVMVEAPTDPELRALWEAIEVESGSV